MIPPQGTQQDMRKPAGHYTIRAAGESPKEEAAQTSQEKGVIIHSELCVYGCAALNKYLPKARNKTGVNLLATTQAEQEEARVQGEVDKAKPREFISYLKPAVSIALLDDATSYPANAVPDHVSTHVPAQALMLLTDIQQTFG